MLKIHSPTADLVRGVPCLSVSLPPPWSITGLLENDGNYDRLGHWISKPYALRTYKYICTNPTAVVRWRVSATAAPHLSNHRLVQEGSDPLRLYWAQKLSFCMGQWRWHTSGTHRIPDAHISEPGALRVTIDSVRFLLQSLSCSAFGKWIQITICWDLATSTKERTCFPFWIFPWRLSHRQMMASASVTRYGSWMRPSLLHLLLLHNLCQDPCYRLPKLPSAPLGAGGRPRPYGTVTGIG